MIPPIYILVRKKASKIIDIVYICSKNASGQRTECETKINIREWSKIGG